MSKGKSKNNQSSRRKFIKTSSGLLVAGAATTPLTGLAATTPLTGLTATPHVAGLDTIRIGLIGCGGRGTQAAIQALNTTSGPVKVVAMGDVFENRLKNSLRGLSNRHHDKVEVPKERQFVGYDAYKKVIASGIDMVILTTPPGFRPIQFEAAVKAGKHVFMEKPVATDAPGVQRVLAATKLAKEKGLAVAVGLQRRHERAYREIIDRLQNGAIGDINLMRCYWNGGGVWVHPRTEGQTELQHQMKNWYYFNWLCGDHITEQHIHNLDVINWLKNGFPVRARGMGGREVRVGKEYGQIYDHFSVEYEYADGSYLLSQCRHIKKCWNSVSEQCSGSKGVSNISGGQFKTKDGKEFKSRGGRGGHQQEHHDLFKDLRDGKIPNEGEYGAKSTMTSILGRMATYTGKQITWDQGINSMLQLADFDSFDDFNSNAPVEPDMDGYYPVPVPGTSWAEVL